MFMLMASLDPSATFDVANIELLLKQHHLPPTQSCQVGEQMALK